jgi:hypothetical protein
MAKTHSAGDRLVRAAALAALASSVLAGAPRAARADGYKDDRLGFSVTPPAKWKQLPISTDDRWHAAAWQCPHEYEDLDQATRSRTRQQPRLDVVVIPAAPAPDPQKPDAKPAAPRDPPPWRDVRDYMDKTVQKAGWGGYHFSREEETRFGTAKVMVYEITVDTFAPNAPASPRRVCGWAFYADDAVYGVVGDCLVKYEDKVKPDLEAAARSFRLIARTGTLPGLGPDASAPPPSPEGAAKDAPKERVTDDVLRKRRSDAFDDLLERIKASLPEGWKVRDSENFTAVSHCDDKVTREVLDHAEALRAWLDENFGFVGGGYAGKVVIRICADEAERDSATKSAGWAFRRCEVVTGLERNGWTDAKRAALADGILQIWFRDRNLLLSWGMPQWFASGLSSCVGSAVSDGRRIKDFKATTRENVDMGFLRRAGKLVEPRTFFTLDSESISKEPQVDRQEEAFVRCLLAGGAHANAKYKGVLSDYLKNLVVLVDEVVDPKTTGSADDPKNADEEDARRRTVRALVERPESLKTLIERTFPGWDDGQWRSFNALYVKDLGG